MTILGHQAQFKATSVLETCHYVDVFDVPGSLIPETFSISCVREVPRYFIVLASGLVTKMHFVGSRFAYTSALSRVQRVSMLKARRLTSFCYADLFIQCITGICQHPFPSTLPPSIPARYGPDSSGTQSYRGKVYW